MTLIHLHKKYYAVPTTWNELTGKQLLRVMEVLYGNYEVDAARLKLLKILTGMSWYRFFRTPMAAKAEFLDVTHFLVNESTLTKQLLPVYKGFYGPADDFNNITGEEFVFSEDFYFKCFTKDGPDEPRIMNEAALNQLVAVLYRPKKWFYKTTINKDGDARKEFNQNIAAYYAKKIIRKWPVAVKLAVFTWYETCRANLIAMLDIPSGSGDDGAKYGLISLMRQIAEGGIHGDFEKVTKMYVRMWMIELNEKYEDAKRAEKPIT